ncbi:hypothetical protein A9Q81_21365 [Gammaproteobacteria bacterium 42_54_T18]|nr:hypothetical protein A9Q81_21365 [Gammaproteobacteria bacterium 42_54_T18]
MHPIAFSLFKSSPPATIRLITALLIFAITGCSIQPTAIHLEVTQQEKNCLNFFDQLDASISTLTFFEASVQRVDDYPIYRSDRFLASFSNQKLTPQEHIAWKKSLHKNAITAYQQEIARLPKNTNLPLPFNQSSVLSNIYQCTTNLKSYFLKKETNAPLNTARLQIKDNYSATARFFGIYPLSQWLAQPSMKNYQKEMTARYLKGQRKNSRKILYQPKTRKTLDIQFIQRTLANAYANNALHIPVLNSLDEQALLAHFSPNLSLEKTNSSDNIGSPEWGPNKKITVNTQKPSAYTFITYTRLNGQVLIQLNYGFWFPERPTQSSFDIYAGMLDGIIWRVTLDIQGKPFFYDSIHQCGCYHKVFLPQDVSYNTTNNTNESPLFFSINNVVLDSTHPVTLNIDSSSHYIVGISQPHSSLRSSLRPSLRSKSTKKTETIPYELSNYTSLSQLPTKNRRKSLFEKDGIIEQSARKERWFLWPLGVVNAGAMRQKGRHAIAFIGRRHFDDAFLWEKFDIKKSAW